jgi:hypothetical protein
MSVKLNTGQGNRKESSLSLKVPVKSNFGFHCLNFSDPGQNELSTPFPANAPPFRDDLPRKRGETTPFLTRSPIFNGRGQGNGPNSPDLAKRAIFLA